MLHLLPRLIALNLILVCAFSLMLLLARAVFATRGGEIAYEHQRGSDWEIYLLDLSNGVSYNLSRHPSDDLDPRGRRMARQIAFSADRDSDAQPELYVMNADGGSVRRVSSGTGGYRNPSWSPDGAWLVFMRGFGQIYRINTDGSGEQRIGVGFLPSLSPDGAALLYSAESTSTIDADIYRISLTNHRITNLTNNIANEWGARWSPDGTLIAFSSLRGGKTNLYVMNADGSSPRAVTTHSRNDLSPAWSPDGARLAYASDDSGTMQLFVIDLDGTNVRQLTQGSSPSHSPAWRPNAP